MLGYQSITVAISKGAWPAGAAMLSRMPHEFTVSRHLDALRDAMVAFIRYADRAGLAARVPTCPGWTVRDLIAHQGMVHRWATAHVRNEPVDEPDKWEVEGQSDPDPIQWMRDGVVELAQALAQAPDDLETFVFLKDAPPAKAFWARRQCHETTMHAVDALSASLGRLPTAVEVDWIDTELALDGIDELLTGFVPRRSTALRTDEGSALAVVPDGNSLWWHVAMSDQPPVTTRRRRPVPGGANAAGWEITGPAEELYLRLWNRAEPPVPNPGGHDGVGLTAVRWSH